jgi:hypothetical protein
MQGLVPWGIRRTIGSSVTATRLLATHLDHHLLEARHDGRRPKVTKVGHPVPRAEGQDVTGVSTIVFPLQHVAGGRRVGALRHGRGGLVQRRARELGVDWLFRLSRRRVAFSSDGLLGVFRLAVGVVVAIAGAFMLVIDTGGADRPFPWKV